MLNKYYKNLSEEDKNIAITRITARTKFLDTIIKQALENKNPLIEIENGQVVINRNSYSHLLKEAEKLSQ
ncbi:hypothetical protein NBT05_06685 [Aquimarina sp. ERC-38]|uniref:hypothetical protein n=1 Tax=Aquimarina sp. ERC-38 TaxID=2949996 RepID=UPI002245C66A|nr:hypothetical protein [Aquimarina sp. ERC-38]UZO82153.1 hypothetical protein NBT05_06685 [Aquimarina sp. ERC-38]